MPLAVNDEQTDTDQIGFVTLGVDLCKGTHDNRRLHIVSVPGVVWTSCPYASAKWCTSYVASTKAF